jgi:hypothetical protein
MLPPRHSMPEGLIPLDEDAVTVKEPSPAPMLLLPPPFLLSLLSMACSAPLGVECHLLLAADECADKGAYSVYARHVCN